VSEIAGAASVLLARAPGSPEVFVVRRSERLKFFGGFFAFPGGKVAPADASVTTHTSAADGQLALRRVTAARELFEETGVLVARHSDGTFPPAGAALDRLRRDMVVNGLPFAEVLKVLGLSVSDEDFVFVGGLTTPAFTPTRFDTSFFVAQLPGGQQAEVWPGELDEGFWTTAAALLKRWVCGECLVSPPTLLLLESIRERPVRDAPARFSADVQPRHSEDLPIIYFAPAVQMIPLKTNALPPTTHSNAFLVGESPAYLLDPGPAEAAEQQRLFDLLDRELAGGKRLAAVVLTHQHPDHIGAASASASRYRVPIWAHALTARALAGKVQIHRELSDGTRLDLGGAPDGSGPWHLEVIHTPGHAAGHLAFFEPHYRLLFGGDMVSTLTSIIVAPPEGDLTAYLDSLERLRQLPTRVLLPGHGSPSARADQLLAESIAHRRRREDQLRAALGPRPRTLDDLTGELYKGLPTELMRFARLQVLAGLEKLQRERQVIAEGDGASRGWQLG
jgi:glyoxylase-like metal-dependent hydrolase (beta-lactamase superfamily II)/8-oxo-dGTP pyrophosphatase MutT (NUDIX family)